MEEGHKYFLNKKINYNSYYINFSKKKKKIN
jgi:hypothetical protein